jgi:hypothetical protein
MNDVILSRRSLAVALVSGTVAFTACGSDDAANQLTSSADARSAASDLPVTDTTPLDTPPADTMSDVDAASGTTQIGSGNVGGPIVDPKPHPIGTIDIAESFPEQLVVRFTSGAPECTAATATATADGDRVLVALEVGITEDALTKSCLAGEFENSVTIPLDEGLGGRDVVPAPV